MDRLSEAVSWVSMKRSIHASVLAACVLIAACLPTASAPAYRFFKTSANVAVFRNTSDGAYVGLRIVFAEPATPSNPFGIGAELALVSNEEGLCVYEGEVPPAGMIEIDWTLNGPLIEEAAWIDKEGTLHPIDVHSPDARIWYELPPGTDNPVHGCTSYVPVDIAFKGDWSKDPDGLPLVDYRWEWSDGVSGGTPNLVRTFQVPGDYTVTLTVWDAEGRAQSNSEVLHIPAYRCPEPPDA